DIARQTIRVLGHDLDGVGAIGLEDTHRPCRADAMAVQEDHDLSHDLLLGPGGDDPRGAHWADAIDLPQPVGLALDYVEDLLAKGAHKLLGVNSANTVDHAGGEILLDGIDRCRGGRSEASRLELLTVGGFVVP